MPLAYMFRFNSKTGFYIYPEKDLTKPVELYLNEGSSFERNAKSREDIKVVKLGIQIAPECSSYDEFDEKMKIAE